RSPPAPGMPRGWRRSATATTWRPTPSFATSSTPAASPCTTTCPTWASPTSPRPPCGPNAVSKRGRWSTTRWLRWTRPPAHGCTSSPPAPAGWLAEHAQAEAHFDKGLSDPAGDRWPFERAQLRLDYGEWLRRQRRINDAKPVLTAAL